MKYLLMLHLCLPNAGTTECFILKEEMKGQQMCEQKAEQLYADFSEVEVFSVKCEEHYDNI